MPWNEYERLILAEWQAVLNQQLTPSEREIQAFLEKHPAMVPGAFNLLGNESGHYPWLCGLMSQPPLPSYDRHVPDFMWLSINSDIEEPVLIEIERRANAGSTRTGRKQRS